MLADPLWALRTAWLAIAYLAGLGLLWHLRVWWHWGQVRRAALRDGQNGALATALAVRRRDACYRVLVKAALAGYAGMRWEILSSVRPAVLDWRQAVDVAVFGAAVLVLTVWSVHSYVSARRRGVA